MDEDLIAATFGVLGFAVLASVSGYQIGLCLPPRATLALFAAVILLASLYSSLVVGRLEIASLVSSGTAIFTTNVTPILILFCVGLAWQLPSVKPRSHHLRFAAMAGLSVVFFFAPLIRPWLRPVVMDDLPRFEDGVCLQSHSATCAAAAAVTLLQNHGVDVSEGEMIRTCLTSCEGTEPLGLYRGLVNQTKSRSITPRLASTDSSLWRAQDVFPVLALVTFRDDVSGQRGSLNRILGRQGDGHAIVVFGQAANGDFMIGDPAFGRTVWDQSTFRHRFSGQAIYLAKR